MTSTYTGASFDWVGWVIVPDSSTSTLSLSTPSTAASGNISSANNDNRDKDIPANTYVVLSMGPPPPGPGNTDYSFDNSGITFSYSGSSSDYTVMKTNVGASQSTYSFSVSLIKTNTIIKASSFSCTNSKGSFAEGTVFGYGVVKNADMTDPFLGSSPATWTVQSDGTILTETITNINTRAYDLVLIFMDDATYSLNVSNGSSITTYSYDAHVITPSASPVGSIPGFGINFLKNPNTGAQSTSVQSGTVAEVRAYNNFIIDSSTTIKFGSPDIITHSSSPGLYQNFCKKMLVLSIPGLASPGGSVVPWVSITIT